MKNINRLNGPLQIKCKHNVNNAEIQAFEYRCQLQINIRCSIYFQGKASFDHPFMLVQG